jgi:hypothetical protein
MVDAKQRTEFGGQNCRVLSGMGMHAGLVGYAARRQALGSHGWTANLWANEEARATFVQSVVHRVAGGIGKPAPQKVQLNRMTSAREGLPASRARKA